LNVRIRTFALPALAVDYLGFRQMHFQAALCQTRLKLCLESLSFLLVSAVDQPIVCIPTRYPAHTMSPSDSRPRPAWPSQASGWSFARPRDGVSRVAPVLVVYVPSSLPRWNCWVPVALSPSDASFPCISARSASTLHVSRPAQRLLALQPAHSRSHSMTLYIGGFSRVVAFPTAPIATGRSDPCRKGLAPSRKPCLSTAHAYFALLPGDRALLPPSFAG
jgi:hypothetical protein